MEKYIDLHTHSVKSDGSMTPAEVVREAKKAGLSAIALTDHDCTDGVKEAVEEGNKLGIEVVPAVELSVKSDTEMHILGLYIDIDNPVMKQTIDECKEYRIFRNTETARKLQNLGLDVTVEDAKAIAPNGIIGRAHFAKVLSAKGYVSSISEAFSLYLSSGKPAFCDAQRLSATEAVDVIRRSGGLAFLAHPHLIKISDDELIELLKNLKDAGLSGPEGYYTDYTPEMQAKFQTMAKNLGMIVSGGTDFHGTTKPHISIGTGTGNMKIPYSVLENIKKAKEQIK